MRWSQRRLRAATSFRMSDSLRFSRSASVKAGREKADPYIRPGDIVIVTEGEPIYITGAVVQPREMTLKDGLTLAPGHHDVGRSHQTQPRPMRSISIARPLPGQRISKLITSAIKKGQAKDIPLQAYDIVDVRKAERLVAKESGRFLSEFGEIVLPAICRRWFFTS